MTDTFKVKAWCKLPEQDEVQKFGSFGLEEFTDIDDYWMQREGLLFYPFDRNSQAYFFPSDHKAKDVEHFQVVQNDLLGKEEYQTSILMAKEEMAVGNFEKVVLARNLKRKQKASPEEVFDKAMETYSNSYCYLIDLGFEQWVGASPELLLHFEQNTLYTVALAGTKLQGEEFTSKEQLEQAMVEDFVEEKLGIAGLSQYHKSEKHEATFNQIKHLKTAYTVECAPENALELLKHLQPTSAVCGLPRDTSFAFISEFETMNRGFYSGITGVMTKESATFFVNLRCVKFSNGEVELFAGAGITEGSDPELEWQETENKLATIEKML